MLLVQVLASIDNTPLMEAPAPGKLLPTTAQGVTLRLPGFGDSKAQLDREVKESMESHFD